jgi:spoIIIJ-associated protein
MNETVYEGKTLEEALSAAAESLKVAPEELAYEVTEESDGGFWGLDEAFVRLRAWQRPEGEETTKVVTADTQDEAETEAVVEDDKSEPQPTTSAEEPPAAASAAAPAPEPSVPPATGTGGFWASPDVTAAEPRRDDNAPTPEDVRATDVTPDAVEEAEETDKEEPPEPTSVAADEESEPETGAGADAGPEIEALVTKILAGMDFDCTVDVQGEADVYMAMVGGADKELLLEGNGRPLSALELILNHAFRHRLTKRRKIRVDAGDFRSRREDELRDLAYQVAHSAKDTASTQETQPLNPYERRLVHLALAEDSGVTTRSRGSGFLKNVQVIPRRSGRGNR